jgi:drug/metabolite transporter (DMT)-like permease
MPLRIGTQGGSKPAVRTLVLLAYAVLYVVWGSTYLAMKIAVTTLPPFVAASLRFAFSGLLLLFIGRLVEKTPITRRHVLGSAVQGLLLLVFGNAAVMFAMRTVPSGVGALVVATTPLFIALFGRDVRPVTWLGIALGLLGVGVLVDPFSTDRAAPVGGVLLLVAASASWGLGAILLKVFPVHPSNATAVGLQMVIGALVQTALAVVDGETFVFDAVTPEAWAALVYLAVFGSLLGFSCYGWLLKVEPATRVATYAYVNPVVAVLLGAWLGHEPLTGRVVLAAAVIVAAVVLILSAGRPRPAPASTSSTEGEPTRAP